MPGDKIRISEFKKALRKSRPGEIVDLDKNYTRKFNFQIHRYEDVLRNSKMSSPPHRWSYFRIGLLTQGEGELISGMYKFRARKNTVVIIPSRVISSSKNWTADVKGYVLLFNLDFFMQNKIPHEFIRTKKALTAFIRPYLHLSGEQAENVAAIFETLLLEKHSDHANRDELIAVKVLELLILIERLFDVEPDLATHPPSAEVLRKFVELLDVHFTKEHSVGFYAGKLFIHPNHLNALIKKHTGLSAKESIQNRLLLETKYLLHSTAFSIKQIAGQMGFSDPNYFSTFFTRAEHLSPVDYRSVYC
jgi:AraC-like DNA-binding protein